MKLTKLFGLAAIVLSANMANAYTYQVHINQYGGTTTSTIDTNSYTKYDGCKGTGVGGWNDSHCYNRYVYNYEVYNTYGSASAAARTHLEAINEAYDNAQNQLPVYDKIDAFVEEYEEITWTTIESIGEYEEHLKNKRFKELEDNTEWEVYDPETEYPVDFTGTYEEFLSKVASEQTKDISGIEYQINPWTKQARIRLVNSDGTVFNKDWIYADYDTNPTTYVSQLVSGLAEESFQVGYATGWNDGYNTGYDHGYIDGYIDGYKDGVASTQ